MAELYILIRSLTTDECRFIRNYLKKQENVYDDALLMTRLFDLVSADPHIEKKDEVLCEQIYKGEQYSAFSKLKSRLFNFILDCLSGDSFIQRETSFDAPDRNIIKLRKKMLQFRLLYRKKNKVDVQVLFHLLNEILKYAKEFEQYDVIIEALYFKKYLTMIRKGFDEIKKINTQIEFFEFTQKALHKANDHYFNLITGENIIEDTAAHSRQLAANDILHELELYTTSTGSESIKYIYQIIQLDHVLKSGDFRRSLDLCINILNTIENSSVLNTKERMGFVYDNLSLCLVHLGEFKNARIHSQKAQTFYSGNSINYLLSLQQEFYTCFYDSDYESALKIIDSMLLFEIMNKGEFRHDKFKFLKACTLFRLNRIKEALSICNQVLEISKDKGRWDLGLRYLKLKCLIRNKDSEGVIHNLESLRKALDRLKSKKNNLERDSLIYAAFKEFSKTSFAHPVNSKLKETLNKLADRSNGCSWEYYSHEVIPVHSWIEENSQR